MHCTEYDILKCPSLCTTAWNILQPYQKFYITVYSEIIKIVEVCAYSYLVGYGIEPKF
jgi:hypothetical protein